MKDDQKPLPFDPKLKLAAEEIQAILKRHDILASMLLVSPSHCEYLFHIESSWSVMKWDTPPDGPDKLYLRFRSKKEDFKDKEAQHFATGASAHAITSFLQFGRMCQSHMQQLLEMLNKHMKIAYKVWD